MVTSKDQFRNVMGRFPTGVTVITTHLDGEAHGMTANAVTSLSLEPMLVLVCVDKNADTHDILSRAGHFAINILAEGQEEISNKFARKEFEAAHGMEGVPHHSSVTGSPIIEGVIAYVDCRTIIEHHGGDHTIFIGEVMDAGELSDAEPLLFYRGRYANMEPA